MHIEMKRKLGQQYSSDKIYLKVKTVLKKDITYKGSIQEEDTTIISIYASNIVVLKYIKQILMDIDQQ